MKKIDHLDSFTLSVFVELYEQKSGTAAAAKLAITQSKVSRTLTSLRHIFENELFIRQQHGMKPNHLADRLYPLAKTLVANYQSLAHTMEITVAENKAVNIAAQGNFHNIIFDCLNQVTIGEGSPFSFELHTITSDFQKKLVNGVFDYCISINPAQADGITRYEIGEIGRYFLVAKKGHPIFNSKITLENILKYKVAISNYALDEQKMPRIDKIAYQKKLPITVALKISDLKLLLDYLELGDCVGLVAGSVFLHTLQERPELEFLDITELSTNLFSETSTYKELKYYLQANDSSDHILALKLAEKLREHFSYDNQ
ncbi:transcriptional regulator-like protein [Shewanella sediminis HAW-EB3]|uniref:Transcriptional regulator-like protein n=1 Tax=Shewanella sediminis (strain HAW-EB3) TaxID=425104 RepID=A8FQK2_SHESH|nr:LysR family transcriptional regulator [Shewanella sediminis]ABV35125.1 transcriptional regulator-like protein [Shewanella sediminis HAW-EB3]